MPVFKKYFNIFKSDAPTITGIAKKNVNVAATFLSNQTSNHPIIVEPLRDVPGTSDNN